MTQVSSVQPRPRKGSVVVVAAALALAALLLVCIVLTRSAPRRVANWDQFDPAPLDAGSAGLPTRIRHLRSGIELVLIEPGSCMRGADEDDTQAAELERPRHSVRITQPFYLGSAEVTRAEWRALVGHVGGQSTTGDDDLPITNLTASELDAELERNGLLLPTEAEWEYACRQGLMRNAESSQQDQRGYLGMPDDAVSLEPVRQRSPLGNGLFGMLGNASELCVDHIAPYEVKWNSQIGAWEATRSDPVSELDPVAALLGLDGTQVIRGGSNGDSAWCRRPSARMWRGTNDQSRVGFRVCWRPPGIESAR
jgi:formylglycine-generating enzyme required for sulfatase activity